MTNNNKARERVQDSKTWFQHYFNVGKQNPLEMGLPPEVSDTIQTALQHLLESLPVEEGLANCPFCNAENTLEVEAGGDGYEYGGDWEYASISARHEESCPLYMSYECGEQSGSIKIHSADPKDVAEFTNSYNTRQTTPALQAYLKTIEGEVC